MILLRAWDGDTPYVALSHVWSQKLGNPHGNSLYECQILWLVELQATLAERYDDLRGPIQFWVDTICCPYSNSEARVKTIGAMRKIYQQAAHVLVVDTEMQQTASKTTPFPDIVALICTSKWTTRLWTLQEVMCAKNIVMVFRDGLAPINSIIECVIHMSNNGEMAVWPLMCSMISAIRSFFPRTRTTNTIVDEYDRIRFWLLTSTLKLRSTTKQTDEAICVGSILGLDVERIAVLTGHESRMREMWTQMCNAPRGLSPTVIFHTSKSIGEDDFTWAPISLLRRDASAAFSIPIVAPAKLTPTGLHVKFPGLALKVNTFHPYGTIETAVPVPEGRAVKLHDTDQSPYPRLMVRVSWGVWLSLRSWYSREEVKTEYPGGFFAFSSEDKLACVLLDDVQGMRDSPEQGCRAVLVRSTGGSESVTKFRAVYCNLETPLESKLCEAVLHGMLEFEQHDTRLCQESDDSMKHFDSAELSPQDLKSYRRVVSSPHFCLMVTIRLGMGLRWDDRSQWLKIMGFARSMLGGVCLVEEEYNIPGREWCFQ